MDQRGRELTEEMVQEAKTWFVDLVAERRKIEPNSVPGLTEGRIYSGRQAVELKLADQIGDEETAMSWLRTERDVPAGLKVVDWKPKAESGGLFGWLIRSMADAFGISTGTIAGLVGQVMSTLKLDGLVSVWHPNSG
jgi:protease-4